MSVSRSYHLQIVGIHGAVDCVDFTGRMTANMEETSLQPPKDFEDFKFPFTPYPIQVDFMRALFTALEEKKIGIFESPTGTVKQAFTPSIGESLKYELRRSIN